MHRDLQPLRLFSMRFSDRGSRSASRYLLAAVGAGTIGLLAEIAQIPGPRNAQWVDLLADAVGIFSALALIASFDRILRNRIRHWALKLLPVAAGVGLTITLLPTLWIGFALVQQHASMPELLTFEHRWESMTYSQAHEKNTATQSARQKMSDRPQHRRDVRKRAAVTATS